MPKRWIEVPARFAVSTCSCGARIVWVPGSRGGKMALDRARERRLPGRLLQLEPHWGYCPDRERHRDASEKKRKRKAPRCYDESCSNILTAGDLKAGKPFCRSHWREIPETLRRWILRTFNPEQLRTRVASREFCEAATSARKILRARRRGAGVTPNLFGADADRAGED